MAGRFGWREESERGVVVGVLDMTILCIQFAYHLSI